MAGQRQVDGRGNAMKDWKRQRVWIPLGALIGLATPILVGTGIQRNLIPVVGLAGVTWPERAQAADPRDDERLRSVERKTDILERDVARHERAQEAAERERKEIRETIGDIKADTSNIRTMLDERLPKRVP